MPGEPNFETKYGSWLNLRLRGSSESVTDSQKQTGSENHCISAGPVSRLNKHELKKKSQENIPYRVSLSLAGVDDWFFFLGSFKTSSMPWYMIGKWRHIWLFKMHYTQNTECVWWGRRRHILLRLEIGKYGNCSVFVQMWCDLRKPSTWWKLKKMSFLYLVKVWTELFLKRFTFLFYLSHIKSYDQMNFGGLRDHIMRKQ